MLSNIQTTLAVPNKGKDGRQLIHYNCTYFNFLHIFFHQDWFSFSYHYTLLFKSIHSLKAVQVCLGPFEFIQVYLSLSESI
jgi:hypothetical protein